MKAAAVTAAAMMVVMIRGMTDPSVTHTIWTKSVWRSSSGDINVVSTSGGTTSPLEKLVAPNDSVTLVATAASGYTFLGWGNAINSTTYLSTNATYPVTPVADKTYYAIFTETDPESTEVEEEVEGMSIMANTSGEKSYELDNDPSAGSGILVNILYGASQAPGPSFTAGVASSVDMGTITDNLEGVTISYDGDQTFTLTSQGTNNYSIAITEIIYVYGATKVELDLRVMTDGSTSDHSGGTVAGGGLYTVGTRIGAAAYPNPGYRFVEWGYGGQISVDNPYLFTITENTVLYGLFEQTHGETVHEDIDNADPATDVYVDSGHPTVSYTLGFTPTTGTTITARIGNSSTGIFDNFTFSAGTSSTSTSSKSSFAGITVQYDGNKTLTLATDGTTTTKIFLDWVEYVK